MAHTNAATNSILLLNGFNYNITIKLGGIIYVQIAPPLDSILTLPFDSTLNDITGNSNNGIMYGGYFTNDRFGNSNSAICLNGLMSNYILISNISPITLTHSLSLWIRTTADYSSSYGCLFMSASNTVGWYLMIYQNKVLIGGNNGSGWNFSSGITTLNNGTWRHIVVNYFGGTNYTAYVDGNFEKTATVNYAISPSPITTIGKNAIGSSYYFTGCLDDINIYNRALTLGEISTLYHFGSWGY